MTEGHAVQAVWNLPFLAEQRLVFEEHHRIVTRKRFIHQALGIGRSGRKCDFQSRNCGEQIVERLAVLRPRIHPCAIDQADHYRASGLAAKHVAELGDLVDQLIAADADEVGKHQFRNWTLAGQRRPSSSADNSAFGNRSINNPFGAEFAHQPDRSSPDASNGFLPARSPGAASNILAEHDDVLVAPHRLANGFVDRVPDCHDRHRLAPQYAT